MILDAPKKTHTEVKSPRLSVAKLADYMAASEQARRGVIQSCKYQAKARVVQHDEAKAITAGYLRRGGGDTAPLLQRAAAVRGKLADSEFEVEVNNINAEYIERFAAVAALVNMPKAELLPGHRIPAIELNGVMISFTPQLLVQRTTKTNAIRRGAVMLRYAKGKALKEQVGFWQAAAMFGLLRLADKDNDEAEKALCVTLDAQSGKTYVAPTNSIYMFNEMKAACLAIAERWLAIKPPKNAIL
jgi:hypothetical protein